MKQQKRLIGVVFLAFAGCEAPREPSPIVVDTPNCAAEEYSRHLWQPATLLSSLELPKNTRIIRPGTAVTMDYRPDRLNIAVGASERIEKVYCG